MPTDGCSIDSFLIFLNESTPRFAPRFIELVSQKASTTFIAPILGKKEKVCFKYLGIL